MKADCAEETSKSKLLKASGIELTGCSPEVITPMYAAKEIMREIRDVLSERARLSINELFWIPQAAAFHPKTVAPAIAGARAGWTALSRP